VNQAIGLIEIVGLASAIKIADTMLKAANVSFKDMQKTKGLGWMVITVKGDVGAVTAAINSGEAEAKQIGKYVSSKVIPRPVDDLSKIFANEPLESAKESSETQKPATQDEPATTAEPKKPATQAKAAPAKLEPKTVSTKKETPAKSDPKKPATQAKGDPKKPATKAEDKAESTSTKKEEAQTEAN
jgi:microcompartment protein CcmL/EutN